MMRRSLNVFFSIWLVAYSIIATGHLGHTHFYGRADTGFCTSSCHNPLHHNIKPDCKGFPLNLTMGVDAQPTIIPLSTIEYEIVRWGSVRQAKTKICSTEHSRAPPTS